MVQVVLHQMQGLPAGAYTRPKGGVTGVFVYTKTLLAFTQKGMQLAKNRATTFPPVLLFPDGDTTFERRL